MRKVKWYQNIYIRGGVFLTLWFGFFFFQFGWYEGAIINVAQIVFILIVGSYAGFIPFKKLFWWRKKK